MLRSRRKTLVRHAHRPHDRSRRRRARGRPRGARAPPRWGKRRGGHRVDPRHRHSGRAAALAAAANVSGAEAAPGTARLADGTQVATGAPSRPPRRLRRLGTEAGPEMQDRAQRSAPQGLVCPRRRWRRAANRGWGRRN